jgi:hypothetical protein
MAITNDQINGYYDNFLAKGKTTLLELIQTGDMSGEEQAGVISKLLSDSMANSLNAIKLSAELELTDSRKKTEDKKALLVVADTELKKHQKYSVIAQRKRQQGCTVSDAGVFTYTSDNSSLIEKQITKVGKDAEFVNTQKEEMAKQVKHNAIIKGMESMSDYVMGIGNAGLKPSQAMHTNFFAGGKILFLEAGAKIDSAGAVTYDINGTTQTIATFDTGATAT